MDIAIDSQPGTPGQANEDWYGASATTVVLLDGATVRTATGCQHDVAWYVQHLGTRILLHAEQDSQADLVDVLRHSIDVVRGLHGDTCDLAHPGTPSAAVAVVRLTDGGLRYLALGDVTIVLDTWGAPVVVADHRISESAPAERAAVWALPVGHPDRSAALEAMKHAELAARNRTGPGGYWIAAAEPAAADHSLTGGVVGWRRLAMLTDGAERIVGMFGVHTWSSLLDRLERVGPGDIIRRVRFNEAQDPRGVRHRRNKLSDDASVVFARPSRMSSPPHPVDPVKSLAARDELARLFPALREPRATR